MGRAHRDPPQVHVLGGAEIERGPLVQRRGLDVDLARRALVPLLPRAREGRPREDPGPVQSHQAIDAELSLRLAPHREHVIDRRRPDAGAG